MIRIILALVLFCSVAQAQPVNPPPALPITLQNGGTELSNIMTTVATAGTINNQALTTEKLKFTGMSVTLTGIVSAAKSQRAFIFNATSSGMTIAHENGSSTAANRITTPQAANYTLPNSQGLWLWYDTVTSRWGFSDIVYTFATPIAVGNSGQVSIPSASGSQTGLLSSTDFTTFTNGLRWSATGNDVYNLNSESILLVRYDCSTLVTYATCAAQVATGCTVVNSGNCSDFDGDESGCNSAGGASQCSYSDPDCSGAYIQGCSGTSGAYCSGDNSSCTGAATACSAVVGSTNCTDQDGCTYGVAPAIRAQGDNITTSDGYLEFEKTSAGAPTSGDCDSNDERGRLVIDTTNNRLYICNGATRLWDYISMTD